MINYLFTVFYLFLSSPMPFEYESLDNSLYLTDYCSEVSIVEWRGNISNKNFNKINEICNKSFFDYQNNILKHKIKNKSFKISIIPFKENGYVRDLNDIYFRFGKVNKGFISGYFHKKSKFIFILNDINSEEFIKILRHEIFHSLNYLNNSSYLKEEEDAIKFENY